MYESRYFDDPHVGWRKVFTGVAATIVLFLVIIVVGFKAITYTVQKAHLAEVMSSVEPTLKSNGFSWDKLELRGKSGDWGIRTLTFRAKNLNHPELGTMPVAFVNIEVEEYSDWDYQVTDFGIDGGDLYIPSWYLRG